MRSTVRLFSLVAALAAASWAAADNKPPAGNTVEARLKIFDELDFVVYSKQQWDRLAESHAEDILVTYPDGHTSKGLKPHIEELGSRASQKRTRAPTTNPKRSSTEGVTTSAGEGST